MSKVSESVSSKLEHALNGKTDGDCVSALMFTLAEILDENEIVSANDFISKYADILTSISPELKK